MKKSSPAQAVSVPSDSGKRRLEDLIPEVYDQLKKLAASQLRGSRQTLAPTALVHEVFLRLQKRPDLTLDDRSRFFGLAAQCMRWLIADYARGKARRGAEARGLRVTFTDEHTQQAEPEIDLSQLHEALETLSRQDPRLTKVVELRYLVGLSIEETAEALQVSSMTVKRDWALAKAWLRRALANEA